MQQGIQVMQAEAGIKVDGRIDDGVVAGLASMHGWRVHTSRMNKYIQTQALIYGALPKARHSTPENPPFQERTDNQAVRKRRHTSEASQSSQGLRARLSRRNSGPDWP